MKAVENQSGTKSKVSDHPGKRLRKALGFTQAKFAESIGIHQSNVSAVEAGARGRRYSRNTIMEIMGVYRHQCRKLGITAEDLMRGVVSPRRRSG